MPVLTWKEREDLILDAISLSGGKKRIQCPLCVYVTAKADRKGALQIYAGGGYHCFKCGEGGKLRRLPSGYRQSKQDPEDDLSEARTPPEGFYLLTEEPARSSWAAGAAQAYLREDRGLVNEEEWAAAKLGVCLSGYMKGRVVIPVLAPDGSTWLGWISRLWIKDAPDAYRYPRGSWRSRVLYNSVALRTETDEPLLVVEGGFDSIWVGLDASTATLGKTSDYHRLALMNAGRPVVFAYDGDEWEAGERDALLFRARGLRAGNLRLGPRRDPDNYARTQVRDAARAAVYGKRVTVSLV